MLLEPLEVIQGPAIWVYRTNGDYDLAVLRFLLEASNYFKKTCSFHKYQVAQMGLWRIERGKIGLIASESRKHREQQSNFWIVNSYFCDNEAKRRMKLETNTVPLLHF